MQGQWRKTLGCAVTALVLCSAGNVAFAQDDAPAGEQEMTLQQAMEKLKELGEKIAVLEERMAKMDAAGDGDSEAAKALRADVEAFKTALQSLQAEMENNSQRIDGIGEYLAGDEEPASFGLVFSGFLRTEYVAVEDDESQTAFIGLNDGFTLGNARFTIDGSFDDISFRLQLDGAINRFDARNTATGRVNTELRDAWFAYSPIEGVDISLGQFKPPFDMEELRSTTDILFVSRAVESRGVRGVEGPGVNGLSLPRQVGVMVSNFDPITFSDLGLGLSYSLAATNGTDANQPLNDNDQLSYTGRLALHYEDMVTLGVGAYYNELTARDLADVIDTEIFGLAADLSVSAYGAILNAQFIQTTFAFPQIDVQNEQVARGFHVEFGYNILDTGLIPAYRFATFDPTAEFVSLPDADSQLAIDEITHHTIGLAWLVPGRPLRLMANYTITIENPARVFNNDRLELAGQLMF